MRRNDSLLVLANVALVLLAVIAQVVFPDEMAVDVALAVLLVELVALQLVFYRRAQTARKSYHDTTLAVLDSFHRPLAGIEPRFPLPAMRVPGAWRATPDFAQLLVQVIHEAEPATVVELGGGVSSLVVGYALEKVGRGETLSLDHEADYVRETSRLVQEHGLDRFVRVVHAPLRTYSIDGEPWEWYDDAALQELHTIDMLIVDGPPAKTQPLARYPAFPLTLEKLSAHATIILDDGIRPDECQIVARWLKKFPVF